MKLLVKAAAFALVIGATASAAGYSVAQPRDHGGFRLAQYGPYHGPGWRHGHGRWGYGPWGYGGPVPYGYYGFAPGVAVPPPYPYPAYEGAPPPPRRAPATDRDFIVYFPFDGDLLTAQARQVVQDAVRYQRSRPGAQVAIVGYTDAAGTEGYNQGLSQRRSEAVRQALAANGVARGEVGMAWRGKHDQAVRTADGVREQANRR
ncbi:MAG: OmpA family protein, partial [Caulobacteraceae bacterium]